MNGDAQFPSSQCALQFLGPILPGEPQQPCPELLTEGEAARYLRLDTIDISNPLPRSGDIESKGCSGVRRSARESFTGGQSWTVSLSAPQKATHDDVQLEWLEVAYKPAAKACGDVV